jgi:hypothetical protein
VREAFFIAFLLQTDLESGANKRDNGAEKTPGTPDQLLVKKENGA